LLHCDKPACVTVQRTINIDLSGRREHANTFLTDALHVQSQLATCRAELKAKQQEVVSLQEQNAEVTAELAWAVKDLLRLRQQDNNKRCLAWLQDCSGLSTVRAAADQNDAEATGSRLEAAAASEPQCQQKGTLLALLALC
jgi:hypothetical protein